jgi:NAD(P)-dependent dehydrogenase (short-subunit alcohol dehydrogenase family)
MNPMGVLNPASVVVVSGGARGITAHCVVKLAQKARCKFILLGRSELESEPDWAKDCEDEVELKRRAMKDLQARGEKPVPTKILKTIKGIQARREILGTLQAVRATGGQAEYVSVDITNRQALQDKLVEPMHRLGPVTGIIHGAGNLADKLIEKKSEKDFETVFSPKVDGLSNLLTCIPTRQLDFLVLFSSIVGFYGNVGQSDYAIANEVLNKTAFLLKRQNPECRVISMNWGPWEAGMVTPELKKAFAERNVEMIPVDVGADILVKELTQGDTETVQVVIGNPPVRPANAFEPELRQYVICRTLSLDANPFLYDHMIGDHPVLPATCAASWIVSTCEQLYPGYTFLAIENYKVLKGIVFDGNQASEYVLDLKEIRKDLSGEIEFDALIWSKNQRDRKINHYSLRALLSKTIPQVPVIEPTPGSLVHQGAIIPGARYYEDGTLFHGPSFQGVDRVLDVSRGRLIMEVVLPKMAEAQQGQFPVQTSNPFIYDAIVQCLLIWVQQYYQAPCLPSGLAKLEQFKAIPFDEPSYVTMQVQSQTETSVNVNILVQDKEGQVYVRVTGLEGTISHHLKKLFGTKTG